MAMNTNCRTQHRPARSFEIKGIICLYLYTGTSERKDRLSIEGVNSLSPPNYTNEKTSKHTKEKM